MDYTVAEAARLLGVSPHTLRYYERDGLLLAPVERASSGHRRYREHDLVWLKLVGRLRATGMPIRDVRRYAQLARQGPGTEGERLELLLTHWQTVLARLAEVTDHLDAVDGKIAHYREIVQRRASRSA